MNLNPGEPDRVIDSAFGRTDAGRVALEADLQLKKTVATLIHPDTPTGRAFWAELEKAQLGQKGQCLSFRQWIVPQPASVTATADALYILDASLDVKLEAQYLASQGVGIANSAGCPPDSAAERIYRQLILPEVVKRVNASPEFADLRAIYRTRVAAEWYRQSHQAGGQFSAMINSGRADSWYSSSGWTPRSVFDRYLKSLRDGEINLRRTTRQGNSTVTETYFYGGVDFTSVPMVTVPPAELTSREPSVEQELVGALTNPGGYATTGETWFGGMYFAPAADRGSGSGAATQPVVVAAAIPPPPPTATPVPPTATPVPPTATPVPPPPTPTSIVVPTSTPIVARPTTVIRLPTLGVITIVNNTGAPLVVSVVGPVPDSWTVPTGQSANHYLFVGNYQLTVEASCGSTTEAISVTQTVSSTHTFRCDQLP